MPCHDPDAHVYQVDEQARLIDKLTRMLCVVCSLHETTLPTEELVDWWERHKAFDRDRLLRELEEKERKRIYEEALAKLTQEERKALGI